MNRLRTTDPPRRRHRCSCVLFWAIVAGFFSGCETPSAHTFSRNYGQRKALPVDPPGGHPRSDDDVTNGGELFRMYCGSCHNARPLGERPFANYQVAIAHMRSQAYLTGKEYRQIIMFLRRWDNVGPPTPPVEPSPKRFVYSQPSAELQPEGALEKAAPPPPGRGPWQQGDLLAPPPGPAGLAPAPLP
jgi:hypothetical protein